MYTESKKTLDKIRSKDEVMFRMAISHLMDVGIRHLTEENIAETCKDIETRDDSKAFMTNGYMCDLVVMAGEIAKVPHTDILVYIQREVDYDVFDGGISYGRLMRLLKNCISVIVESHCDSAYIREDFEMIGFDDDELVALGCDWVMNEEEENDDEM